MDKKKGKLSRGNSVDDRIPEAKYTRFGEKIRQAIPGPMQCSVGCGGRNCKWENPARWSDADQAIKGVFSSWVLDDVVAMSRPSTEIIKKYKMIEQFKTHNIRSIINLQRPGEHASCGPPLEKESLFTYRPQQFMDNDIFFYNFGWKDYGVTSMHTILDMVKVMSFALEEGRVAVHCHAGLGRTGVLIACYLVYADRMDPAAAILRVRKNRDSSIQTRGQIACINEFWQFLRPLRIVFPQVVPHAKRLTLKQFLTRQRHLLHGMESRELRHIPKLIHEVCKRLCQIANAELNQENTDVQSLNSVKRCNTVADIRQTNPKAFVNEEVEASDKVDPVLEILKSSPTHAEAVLSPRASRKSSARSVSSLDTGRPHSACGDPRLSVDDEVFLTKNSEMDKSTPKDSSMSLKTDQESSSDARSTENASNSQDVVDGAIDMEKLKEIPDEQIEREVDEILGCNSNNNHALTRTINLPVGLDVAEEGSDSLAPEKEGLTKDIQSYPVSQDSVEPLEETSTQNVAQNPSGGSLKKVHRSAGISETILPTGLPLRNARNSAKEKRPSIPYRNTLPPQEDATSTGEETSEANTLRALGHSLADDDDCTDDDCERTVHAEVSSNVTSVSEVGAKVSEPAVSLSSSNTIGKSHSQNLKQKPMFTIEYPDVKALVLEKSESGDSLTDSLYADKRNTDIFPPDEIQTDDLSASPTQPQVSAGPHLTDAVWSPEASAPDSVETAPSLTAGVALLAGDVAASLVLAVDENQTEIAEITDDAEQLQDVSDDNLDEVIDIDDNSDDQRSLDGDSAYENENDATEANLSNSVASRVSWSQMQRSSDTNRKSGEENREFSASSKKSQQSGRRTPLMYRAEKNLALMNDGKSDDASNGKSELKSKSDSSDDDVVDSSNPDQDANTDDKISATDVDVLGHQLSLKLPIMPRISAARSLNDLASAAHIDSPVTFSRCSSSGDMRHPSPHGHQSPSERINPTNVALAISYKLIDDEWLWEKVYSMQVEINNHKDGWKTLGDATDAYLLASLMWSWVEHLSEPVMAVKDAQQLLAIVDRASPTNDSSLISENFEKALSSLEPSVSNTTKCLLSCVISFPALPKRISETMVERIISAITQTALPPAERTKTNEELERAFQRYISAKYDVNNKIRFIDDVREQSKQVERTTSLDSVETSSEGDDVTDTSFSVEAEVDPIIPRSAGSVRSSGSSAAGSAVMTTPRIVVN